jgi:hypothetical protein
MSVILLTSNDVLDHQHATRSRKAAVSRCCDRATDTLTNQLAHLDARHRAHAVPMKTITQMVMSRALAGSRPCMAAAKAGAAPEPEAVSITDGVVGGNPARVGGGECRRSTTRPSGLPSDRAAHHVAAQPRAFGRRLD